MNNNNDPIATLYFDIMESMYSNIADHLHPFLPDEKKLSELVR